MEERFMECVQSKYADLMELKTEQSKQFKGYMLQKKKKNPLTDEKKNTHSNLIKVHQRINKQTNR